ncbi:MAG: 3-phosphoshikimate 1-carboxyvinyltransferase [Gammaproteobacteria bacterium]|nr:3-phosphoshikimate 1-carboxyvinyltransferase [Gammaproteobacteria bacterium]
MKQLIRAVNSPIHAHVTIPGSKSITNRALLLAALSEGVAEIFDILLSDDTWAFINALKELGIVIQVDESTNSCLVAGGMGEFPHKEASIWCDNAGTVARFLLAACAATPGVYRFDASPQLRRRPIAALLRTLCGQGAKVLEESESMPFTIVGSEGLRGGEIEIESSESSQFVSALLMVAPFAASPVLIKTHELVSNPYVDMTCAMMADFGVLVRRMHSTRFSIPAPQRYVARDYTIEPDLSTASYFFAAAAVTAGKMTIQAVDRINSKQADVEFLSVLEKMGCEVISTDTVLTVKGPEKLQGINVDMRHFSDTFMTLAAIAPFAETPTMITNIAHTRQQESNRISAMREGLERLQVKVEEGPDWLKIYPSKPVAALIDSHSDHRIAMAFSIIGLRVPGIEIEHAECVAKTCPTFFEMWDGLQA